MVALRRAALFLCPVALLVLTVAGPTRASTGSDENLLFSLINNYRVAHGLHALHLSSGLRSVAEWRSGDMLLHDYQGHQIPAEGCATVSAALRQRGIGFRSWGEIFAWNDGDGSLSATKAFDWWLGSSEHLKLILDSSFTTMGVGAEVGSWASRRPACSEDSSGIDASGVHMYTVVFIQATGSSGSGGSGGSGGTGGRPTAPRPATNAAPRAPGSVRVISPAQWPATGRGSGDGSGPLAPVGADGMISVPAARTDSLAAVPGPAGQGNPIAPLVAGLGIAVGVVLAAGRRGLRRGPAPRASRSGSRWP